MNAIEKSFDFEGYELRSVIIDGEPWFIAADAARVLDLSNVSVAVSRLDDDERSKFNLGRGELVVVSEYGLYSLILGSRKPEARLFKRWITHEVIPSIRRTGRYEAPKTLEQRSLELMGELTAEVQRQAAEIKELTPLATQARTFNRRKGNVGRQEFARDIVAWAVDNGYRGITVNDVYAFMGGQKLDMFIHDRFRRDHGNASVSGLRRGMSFTHKGVSPKNGHEYEQGMLLPKGYEYAWQRIEHYVREYGHLELPKTKKGIAA